MTELFVIDSYAWIEYFGRSERADVVEKIIDGGGAVTPAIVLTEIVQKFKREGLDFKQAVTFIDARSKVVEMNKKIAVLAGEIGHERRKVHKDWPIADSIILATAREIGAKVVTGDEHFLDLVKETVIMK